MRTCVACGNNQLAEGQLVSTGTHLFVYGSPIDFKLKQGGPKLNIKGLVCSKCGHLELIVNPKQLPQFALLKKVHSKVKDKIKDSKQ